MPSITSQKRTVQVVALLCLFLIANPLSNAQAPADPQKEQLLNGLRLLFWAKPGSPDVLLKLRIHSGAAFDLAGKSGEMALLGDLLFPDRATIDYFTEEMNGRLSVDVNYDSITVTLEGRAKEFERIVEVLRNALLATQLTPDVVARMREARAKIVRETAVSPATVADRAIASRLFGDFPYGRPASGSSEDIARIDTPDLMLARERFLNPNNATLVIAGGVEIPRAMRTLRQLLGAWRKSEQIVPTTFRQPTPADARTLVISGPTPTTEIRLAVRGLSRSDPDAVAAMLLAKIAQYRWEQLSPGLSNKAVFVRSEAHVLPGMFVMGAAVNNDAVADTMNSARKVIDGLVHSAVSGAELERAQNELATELSSSSTKIDGVAENWVDRDTYKLSSLNEQLTSLHAVTPGTIQRVATRLFKDAAAASVAIGDSQQLKAALRGRLQFEVLGEIVSPAPASKPPVKPGGTQRP